MEFKKLQEFNLAMLSKQVWKLVSQLESMVAKMMKAKYYSTCSFLQAKLGNNPSYILRGIMEAHPIVENGVRLQVGNGTSISIWKDPWVTTNDRGVLTSPMVEGFSNASVSALICEQSGH